ncbi:Ammonium transporter NrgA [Novipirellula aureliae]|uniref:Ammonium transporter n=2 Tax=Novipirellula aureliae TaxID=2527966 RepID=A0A5C6E0Z3_9BACT|nr:ammonium transporter [Novipirellula aureliae]TWU41627.1 Ammonium transporter NrgA [Novipirellula aureliae]
MFHSFRVPLHIVMCTAVLMCLGMMGVGLPLASVASAQDEPVAVSMDVEVATDAGAVDAAVEEAAPVTEGASLDYTINTLIMFLCAVLVLFMQAGFAMVEVGLNSAKNTVNILAKNVMDLGVGVILFLFVGWGIMYPGDFNIIGDGILGYAGPWVDRDVTPNLEYGFSHSADFLFQVAFAATAATIVSGAVAGRMKFGAYLIYSAFLTGLIYPISGGWKWGGGFLDAMGFQDFAGSVVVHAVGGFAGLAGAIALGPRLGRYTSDGKSVPLPGHNIAFAALGVFILWVGWYGFNPGSQLTYSGAANAEATTYIALTTTLAAAAGAVTALVTGWALFGKPDLTMALNGVLGGLVAITANCDRVSQGESLLIGAIGGALVVLGIVLLDKVKIDDPVGAWPVHGLCGVWGGLATGLFGELPEVNDVLLSRGEFIWVQCLSTGVIVVWAFATMAILFFALKAIGFLRVSAEHEAAGLDISEHGMHAYPSDVIAGGAVN